MIDPTALVPTRHGGSTSSSPNDWTPYLVLERTTGIVCDMAQFHSELDMLLVSRQAASSMRHRLEIQ